MQVHCAFLQFVGQHSCLRDEKKKKLSTKHKLFRIIERIDIKRKNVKNSYTTFFFHFPGRFYSDFQYL